MQYLWVFFLVSFLNVIGWFGTNFQFMKSSLKMSPILLCLILSIPTQLLAYVVSNKTFELTQSVYGARFITTSGAWLVFPIMTWLMLDESFVRPKVIVSFVLLIVLVLIQVLWKE